MKLWSREHSYLTQPHEIKLNDLNPSKTNDPSGEALIFLRDKQMNFWENSLLTDAELQSPCDAMNMTFDLESIPAYSPTKLWRGCNGFSLIETLAVLAIMSVLAYLTLPAITSLQQSGSLTGAGNEVTEMAVYAQQYAIAHNEMTALVGMTTSSASPSSQYRAFIVLARDPSGNWSPANQWTRLPAQTSMSSVASADTFLTYQGSYYTGQSFATIFPSLTINGAPVTSGAYQFFLPDGRMATSAASVDLRVVTTQHQSDTNPQNWYDLIFNPTTGTVTVNRP